MTSLVNVKKLEKVAIFEKFGVIIAAPNHPAEILMHSPENARSQGLVIHLAYQTQANCQERQLMLNSHYAVFKTFSKNY